MFHKHQGVSPIHKMAYTGVFLAVAIIFQFLSGFMHFAGTFINLNFSLLFILPIFYYSGRWYGISAIILRFGIGIGMDVGIGNGMEFGMEGLVLGHFILLICSSIAIGFQYIYSHTFHKIKKHEKKLIIISGATMMSTVFMTTFLNMILFTPAYFALYPGNPHKFSIALAIKDYSYLTQFFFFIKNYWAGTFVVYFSGNLVKFGLIYIIYIPFAKVLRNLHPKIAYGKER